MTEYKEGLGSPLYERSGGASSLDTQETSNHSNPSHSYRTFLGSGSKADLDFNGHVYQTWDELTCKRRYFQYQCCKNSAWFVVGRESREVKVQSSSCGLRWCPFCIRSRRYVITDSVFQWLQKRKYCRFITLTLRHRSAALAEQITDLYYFFKQLRKTKLWKKNVKGGIWFFQTKRSKDDRYWHPHLHILTEGKFFDQEELRELWRKITHGSYIVDIRLVKNLKTAAQYVARYAAAPMRLLAVSADHALEAVQAMHGKRICGTFGTAKGIALRPVKPEDTEEWVQMDSYFNVSQGVDTDPLSHTLWVCWTTNAKYEGPLPEIPPPVSISNQTQIDEPKPFNQHFFEFIGSHV